MSGSLFVALSKDDSFDPQLACPFSSLRESLVNRCFFFFFALGRLTSLRVLFEKPYALFASFEVVLYPPPPLLWASYQGSKFYSR